MKYLKITIFDKFRKKKFFKKENFKDKKQPIKHPILFVNIPSYIYTYMDFFQRNESYLQKGAQR